MSSKRFQKRIEDFVCKKCGMKVRGNGYTDHCPNCLWGRHVDINPGDRKAECGGMMEPANVFKKEDGYVIEYICQGCGHKFRVKSAKDDRFEALLNVNKVVRNKI